MSTSVISDSIVINSGPEGPVNMISGQIEVDFVKCDCCGLTEECTLAYIETIRQRYGGKWICGLCGEAVKDEILRCQKLISPDEAMARHFSFCNKIRTPGPPQDPTVHLIRAMRQIMIKSLESSPKTLRSMPSSPTSKGQKLKFKGTMLGRSESCMSGLTLVCGMDDGCKGL